MLEKISALTELKFIISQIIFNISQPARGEHERMWKIYEKIKQISREEILKILV